MAKSKSNKSSSSSGFNMPGPVGIGVITVGAILIVGGIIMLSGGFAAPTEAPPALDDVSSNDAVEAAGGPLELDSLLDCAGSPCPAMGAEDAPVTMIEVSEYGCPHCRDHNMDIGPLIIEEFVEPGDLRLVSHVFAFGPGTIYISSASLCAKEQGKYFEFQAEAFKDDLATSGADLAADTRAIAERLDLDVDEFMECTEEVRFVEEVQQSSLDAQRAGIQYTPTFVINGLTIEGGQPIDIFRTKIEQALDQSG